jgi:hypothetical protein
MAVDRPDSTDPGGREWYERLEAMMDEYRAAERRRVLEALWKRARAAHQAALCAGRAPAEKVH